MFLCAELALAQTPVGTLVTNEAWVEYADAGGATFVSKSGIVQTSVAEGAQLTVTIVPDHTPIAPGDSTRWVITVRNVGNIQAREVTLVSTLDASLEILATDAGALNENHVAWETPVNLTPGADFERVVVTRAAQEAPIGGIVVSVARAQAANVEDSVLVRAQVEINSAPNLVLNKISDRVQVAPGGQIVYTLTYENRGSITAPQPRLSDQLPSQLVFVSASPVPNQITDGVLVWVLPDVPPGGKGQISLAVRVRSSGSLPAKLTNQIFAQTTVAKKFGESVRYTTASPIHEIAIGGLLQNLAELNQPPSIVAGQNVTITLIDHDLNAHADETETYLIKTVNSRTGEQETTLLRESQANSGVFAGNVGTFWGNAGVDGDGRFLVQDGDLLTSAYVDAAATEPRALSAHTVVRPTLITLVPFPETILANGKDQSILTARVTDIDGNPLPDGTLVTITADKGTLPNGEGAMVLPVSGGKGEVGTVYTAPLLATRDTAQVFASFGGHDSDIINLEVLTGYVAIRVFDQVRDLRVTSKDTDLRVKFTLIGFTVAGEPIEFQVETDENGLFIIPAIPPGKYQLRALVENKQTGKVVSNGVLQQITVLVDGSVSPPENAVSGSILGKNKGISYAGLPIDLLDADGNVIGSTVSDEDGRYDFHGFPPGSYTLRVQFPDGTLISAEVASHSKLPGAVVVNANILIDPFGIVFDAATGKVIPGATVALRRLSEAVLNIPLLSGTGVPPNKNNINPFITSLEGRYAFLFAGNQVGALGKPAIYLLTVAPPPDSPYQPRRFLIKVQPTLAGPVDQVPIAMQVLSNDGQLMALPNTFTLTSDPVDVADIEAMAFNIPLFALSPSIVFVKTATPHRVTDESPVQFHLSIANAGNDTAHALAMLDTLDARWRIVSIDRGEVIGGNVVRWSLGDLLPGQRDSLRIEALPLSIRFAETRTNRAWVISDVHPSIQAEVNVSVIPEGDLFVRKWVDSTVASLGDTLTYTLVLANRDSTLAQGPVVLTDTLSAALELVAATGNPTIKGQIISWRFDALDPFRTDTLQIAARIVSADHPINNVAYADQADVGLIHSEIVTTSIQQPVSLRISKTVDPVRVIAGDVLTYELLVGTDTDTLREVSVRDTLPIELAPVLDTVRPVGVYDSLTHVLTWTVAKLAPGSPQRFTFKAKDRPGLSQGEHRIHNVGVAAASGRFAHSEAAEVVLVVPFFKIEKTANPTVAEIGDFVSYRISLKNTSGIDSLAGVEVSDILPPGFRYVQNSARLDGIPVEPDLVGAREIAWSLSGPGAGQTQVLSYRLILGSGAEFGDGANRVTARATTQGGNVFSAGPSVAHVRVRPGIFVRDEVIVGRAWVDVNGNGIVDRGEDPVPNVVLMMEDGTRIVADRHGLFSIPEMRTGDHVLRLLNQNIPRGLSPVVLGTRSAENPWIRFVSLSPSGMAKANFPFHRVFSGSVSQTVRVQKKTRFYLERHIRLRSNPIFSLGAFSYGSGQANLLPPGLELLQAWVDTFKTYVDHEIVVSGHTDAQPISNAVFSDNVALSVARAEAVKTWLIAAGIDTRRITTRGFGARHPLAENDTAEGRRRNRRVEIELQQSEMATYDLTMISRFWGDDSAIAVTQGLPGHRETLHLSANDSVTTTYRQSRNEVLQPPAVFGLAELSFVGRDSSDGLREVWQSEGKMLWIDNPDTVWAGAQVVYRIDAFAPAGGVVLDALPSGLRMLHSEPFAEAVADTIRWHLEASEDTLSLLLHAQVDSEFVGMAINWAALLGADAVIAQDSTAILVVPRPPGDLGAGMVPVISGGRQK